MLKKLKEIGGKPPSDFVGKIPDSLEERNFAIKEVSKKAFSYWCVVRDTRYRRSDSSYIWRRVRACLKDYTEV